jgi:phosphate transport system permease protein
MVARGFGAAAVLLALVLTLFLIARALGGKAPGELSDRQRRRALDASTRDEARFIARANRAAATALPEPPASLDKVTA